MKINLNGYTVKGTPEEMIDLIVLLTEYRTEEDPKPEQQEAEPEAEPEELPEPDRGGDEPKVPKPLKMPKMPKVKPPKREVDWAKAQALRNAGWSYKKIGDELGVADVTVAAHLKK